MSAQVGAAGADMVFKMVVFEMIQLRLESADRCYERSFKPIAALHIDLRGLHEKSGRWGCHIAAINITKLNYNFAEWDQLVEAEKPLTLTPRTQLPHQ